MFARVITGQYLPRKADEGTRLSLERWERNEQLRRQRGLVKGLIGIGNRETGVGIEVTLFVSEADAAQVADNANASPGYREYLAKKGEISVPGSAREQLYEVPFRFVTSETAKHARLLTGRYLPGKLEEGLALIRRTLGHGDALRWMTGLFCLLDQSTGKSLVLNLFATEAEQARNVEWFRENPAYATFIAKLATIQKDMVVPGEPYAVVYQDLQGIPVGRFVGELRFPNAAPD